MDHLPQSWNPNLQSAIDVKNLDLLVQDEMGRGMFPMCGDHGKNDDPSDTHFSSFAPDEVNKAFAVLLGEGYKFARPVRAIYWKQDNKNYWI